MDSSFEYFKFEFDQPFLVSNRFTSYIINILVKFVHYPSIQYPLESAWQVFCQVLPCLICRMAS